MFLAGDKEYEEAYKTGLVGMPRPPAEKVEKVPKRGYVRPNFPKPAPAAAVAESAPAASNIQSLPPARPRRPPMSSAASPSRSGGVTPTFAYSAIATPHAASPSVGESRRVLAVPLPQLKIAKPAVDEAIDKVLGQRRLKEQTGEWRANKPWTALLVKDRGDFVGEIADEDSQLLWQVYSNEWTPTRQSHLFGGKIQAGKIRLTKPTTRTEASNFISFVEGFWARFRQRYAFLRPIESAQLQIRPPKSDRFPLPDDIIRKKYQELEGEDVKLSPEFWETMTIKQSEEMGAARADRYFDALLSKIIRR